MEILHRIKLLKRTILIVVFFLLTALTITLNAQTSIQLPKYLVTEYTGVLAEAGSSTRVDTDAKCIIKKRGFRTYHLNFGNGVSSLSNIKFIKNDDTYTSTIIHQGKTLSITLDEDGDLFIGSTAKGVFSFSGSISDEYERDADAENINVTNNGSTISLGTGNTNILIENGETNLSSGNSEIHIDHESTSLDTGNISISTSSASNNLIASCFLHNDYVYEGLIHCNSTEISTLPSKVVGIYRGKLKTYEIETKKGICTIVKTGCKTYRLDFSNGIPSIHNIQFGRKNDFDEYTSVIIEGVYSSAIEIDMSFDDLEIDGKILRVSFDGKKN